MRAASNQVPTSAKGYGLVGAFTGLADDPSALYYNPAGLVQVKGTVAEFGTNFVFPTVRYRDANSNDHSSIKKALSPYLYITSDALHPVVLGFGAYSPFTSNTSYVQGPSFSPRRSFLVRSDYTAGLAYEITEKLSAGGGFTLSYGQQDGQSTRSFGVHVEESSGFGTGGVLGVLYRPFKQLQAGVAYRLRETVHFKGKASQATTRDNFSAKLHFPQTLSFGLAVRPVEFATLTFNLDWVEWSYYKKVRREFDVLTDFEDPVKGRNLYELSYGIEIEPKKDWVLRAGYFFDDEFAPSENIVPTAIDVAMHVVGLGLTKKFTSSEIHLGYNVALGAKRSVADSPNFSGNYDLTAHLLTLAFRVNNLR